MFLEPEPEKVSLWEFLERIMHCPEVYLAHGFRKHFKTTFTFSPEVYTRYIFFSLL